MPMVRQRQHVMSTNLPSFPMKFEKQTKFTLVYDNNSPNVIITKGNKPIQVADQSRIHCRRIPLYVLCQ